MRGAKFKILSWRGGPRERVEDAPWRVDDAPWRVEDAPWRVDDAPWRVEDAPWRMCNPCVEVRIKKISLISTDIHSSPLISLQLKIPFFFTRELRGLHE